MFQNVVGEKTKGFGAKSSRAHGSSSNRSPLNVDFASLHLCC